MYQDFQLYIDGEWTPAKGGGTRQVFDPATEDEVGKIADATPEDLDRAKPSSSMGLMEIGSNLSAQFVASALADAGVDLAQIFQFLPQTWAECVGLNETHRPMPIFAAVDTDPHCPSVIALHFRETFAEIAIGC